MRITAELSLYPLTDDYISTVQSFIHVIQDMPGLRIRVNQMSTQLTGELGTHLIDADPQARHILDYMDEGLNSGNIVVRQGIQAEFGGDSHDLFDSSLCLVGCCGRLAACNCGCMTSMSNQPLSLRRGNNSARLQGRVR